MTNNINKTTSANSNNKVKYNNPTTGNNNANNTSTSTGIIHSNSNVDQLTKTVNSSQDQSKNNLLTDAIINNQTTIHSTSTITNNNNPLPNNNTAPTTNTNKPNASSRQKQKTKKNKKKLTSQDLSTTQQQGKSLEGQTNNNIPIKQHYTTGSNTSSSGASNQGQGNRDNNKKKKRSTLSLTSFQSSSIQKLIKKIKSILIIESFTQSVKYKSINNNSNSTTDNTNNTPTTDNNNNNWTEKEVKMKRTIVDNIKSISITMNRRPQYLMKFIGYEIGKTCYYDLATEKGIILHEHLSDIKKELTDTGNYIEKEIFIKYENNNNISLEKGLSKVIDSILIKYINNYVICPNCKSIHTTNPILVDNEMEKKMYETYDDETQVIEHLDNFTYFGIQCRDCGTVTKLEKNTDDGFVDQIIKSRQRNLTKTNNNNSNNDMNYFDNGNNNYLMELNNPYYPNYHHYGPTHMGYYYYPEGSLPYGYHNPYMYYMTAPPNVQHQDNVQPYPYPFYSAPMYPPMMGVEQVEGDPYLMYGYNVPSTIVNNEVHFSSSNGGNYGSDFNSRNESGNSSNNNSSSNNNESNKPIDVESVYKAAGILAYSINKEGKLVFLLGKELRGTGKAVKGTVKNSTSPYAIAREIETWSEFGGKKENSDKSSLHTAAREFTEETAESFEKIEEKLLSSPSIYYAPGKYKLFICQVDYIENTKILNNIKDSTQDCWTEKTNVLWVDGEKLIKRILEKEKNPDHYHQGLLKVPIESKELEVMHPFAFGMLKDATPILKELYSKYCKKL
ncbi:hypothetical protein ABK040_013517 [Willaertia magna]